MAFGEDRMIQKFILSMQQASAICFSGPRPSKLPYGGDKNAPAILEIGRRLEDAVRAAVLDGKTAFLNGCMAGFDVMAGETVLRLKKEYPQIQCITVAPFRVGYFNNRNWDAEWKQRALALYRASDLAFPLYETYHKRVYYERNDFLVAHAGGLICYNTGTGGGTAYTCRAAKEKRMRIVNLAYGQKQG